MATKTVYTVTVVCEVTASTIVADCKTWKKAAKKAAPEIQKILQITHTKPVQDFEAKWQRITENDCIKSVFVGKWLVSQSAELAMTVEVHAKDAKDWKTAATKALEVAQNSVEIVAIDDIINVDWQQITEDMVN